MLYNLILEFFVLLELKFCNFFKKLIVVWLIIKEELSL